MKPTVITNSNSTTSAGSNNTNGITIPINREYSGGPTQPQYHTQSQHYIGADPHNTAGYATSPGSYSRLNSQQQHQPPQTTQQQIPAHFQQEFNFDPDIDMNMFPRSRLGRIHHDPFSGFGTGSSQFGFPQFNSLGRRRTTDQDDDDDFFRRMPQEFRQYIPENFAQRRSTGGVPPHQPQGPYYQTVQQSPSKVVCDAAIQTEDLSTCRDQVDHVIPARYDNLSQHGLRNTMDMGVKSPPENANQTEVRSQSAPTPPPQQQVPLNGRRTSPPGPQQHTQYGTETSPPIQKSYYAPQQQHHYQQQQPQQPQQRPVYTKQQTPPPPQTPRGSYVRTIPIFVEGRMEPLINNREIPAQNNTNTPTPSNSATRAFTPPKQQHQQQQQHRPSPLNTQQQQHQQQPQKPIPLPEPPTPAQQLQNSQQQQQQQQINSNTAPPQTPHTLDSIQRIQDIQHDVLELMSHVEKFLGTRGDKDYAYLDEMLTRNLLKLDNIDTNGKESIRLARKEAIKCIQASINVLEAKAEENRKKLELQNSNDAIRQYGSTEKVMPANQSASGETSSDTTNETATASATAAPSKTPINTSKKMIKAKKNSSNNEQPSANNIIQQPIPLPPPEGIQPVAEPIIETPETNSEETATEDSKKKTDIEQAKEKVGGSKDEPVAAVQLSQEEPSPQADTTKLVSDQTEQIAK